MSVGKPEVSSYKGRRGLAWLRVLLALVLAGCLFFGGLLAAVLTGAHDQVKGDPQIMVILGCQVKPWGPSILLQDRLDTALAYLEEHPGMTVVVSSHLLSEIDQMADTVGIIREGELVFQDTLEALHGRSRHHLALRTTNNAVARNMLAERPVPCQEEEGYLILPILSDEMAAQLTSLLAERRLGIIRLEERQKSLEDIFLELTGRAVSL